MAMSAIIGVMQERPPTGFVILSWNEAQVSVPSALSCINSDLRPTDSLAFVDNGSSISHIRSFASSFSTLVPTFDIETLTDHRSSNTPYTASHENIHLLFLPHNTGPSIGRLKGIELIQNSIQLLFLIDGDILYVPGSADLYSIALAKASESGIEVGCVGCSIPSHVAKTGTNGTMNLEEADEEVPFFRPYAVFQGLPMAWTQYGLFRRELVEQGLPSFGVFGEAGHGYEDDWLCQHMIEAGHPPLHIEGPMYYHQASSGLRELEKAGLQSRTHERMIEFYKRSPNAGSWKNFRNCRRLFSISR